VVIGVNFAAGGDVLVSAAFDGSSRLWDPWAGRELLRFAGDARHVSRDGRRLAARAGRSLSVWGLDAGGELLTFPSRGGQLSQWSVSGDGRWLVAGGYRLRIWDLALRKEAASLPVSGFRGVKIHPTTQELFMNSQEGLSHWSVEASDGTLRIRPRGRLLPPNNLRSIDLSADGRLLAAVCSGGASVLDLGNPAGGVRLLRHEEASSLSVSPDGRWAATGTHGGFGVRVWDVRTGNLATELIPGDRSARPVFSPDGQSLLIATGAEFGVWEPGSWRQVRHLPREQTGEVGASAAFSPDGKVLAAAVSLTTVRLFDTETWRPLVRLEGPAADLIGDVGFTPDGSQLFVSAPGGILRVWDLRRIREQLARGGLDWDRPPYPPPAAPAAATPVKVEVDLGVLDSDPQRRDKPTAGKGPGAGKPPSPK
jgi:WD40 repeat protein